MKRLQIALIGLTGAVMVLLCVVLGMFLTREIPPEGHGNYSLVQEKKFPAKDIQRLKIDYGKSSADVLFYQGTGDEIIVREYMNFEPGKNQLSAMEQSDGELTIRGARLNRFLFFSIGYRGAYTEIYLPADFAQEMEALAVKTVSGDILSEIGLIIRDGFTVSTTSGDVRFPKVQAGRIQASSTSGDIALGQTTGSLTMSTTSGSIRLDGAEGEEADISTTSGDITVGQAQGRMEVSTTSGGIQISGQKGSLQISTTSGDITLGQVTGDMTLSTTSGLIRLKEGQGDFDAESTSGDIRVGSLAGRFDMDTTSGELSVSGIDSHGAAHSVSGDIQILLTGLAGDLDISTTSGTVELGFPKTASFQFCFDTTSGECQTFFDDVLSFDSKRRNAKGQYGEGRHLVEISTVSGDLEVRAVSE